MSEVFNVYRLHFAPPISEEYWPPYGGPTVIPDPNMRRARAGRHGRLGSGQTWMTSTLTDLGVAGCVGRLATLARIVIREVLLPVMVFKFRSLSLDHWAEVVISQPWSFHEEWYDVF
ncbi:hypothetical protein PIB30_019242 [Stylosanthes scabra]|uniref:Uncharacterized protein n=1 Tax=Stylosanthes scabra TaxID=79078 RepID=A0ABU6R8F3_9FABA|nr:hypothetical protein [Stylosanthes scabra]